MTKAERLNMILERLKNAPTPFSFDEALSLVNETVKEIENQCSGHPYQEHPPLRDSGRMYGPRSDSIKDVRGGRLARTRGNFIYFWNDGSFDILDLAGTVVLFNHHKKG